MAIPALKLNLVPPPTTWRVHHRVLGWATLLLGILALGATLAQTVITYRQAMVAGRNLVTLDARSRQASQKQSTLQARLEAIDVEKELPRWRLAERILTERGVPWSRLSAELERSLVQDVRLHSIQRTRDTAQNIQLKLKVEARNRAAEDALIDSLNKNTFFGGVILEREAENQFGGVDLECTLPIASNLVPYEPLPKYGPAKKNPEPPKAAAVPQPKPVMPSRPAPIRATAPPSQPQRSMIPMQVNPSARPMPPGGPAPGQPMFIRQAPSQQYPGPRGPR